MIDYIIMMDRKIIDEPEPKAVDGLLIIVAVYIENDEHKLNILKSCIQQFRKVYEHETIVLVDNNSKNVEWYELALSLNMHIIKNKSNHFRYEIGAYRLALKYFRAERYMCIQGTIFFNSKIVEDIDALHDDVIIFKKHYTLSWNDHGLSIINKYLNFLGMTNWNHEPLVLYNCFYCSRPFMEKMIETGILDLLCNHKNISCAYERILGTYFHRTLSNKNIKEVNPETYKKIELFQQ